MAVFKYAHINIWFIGENEWLRNNFLSVNVKVAIISMDRISAITPPSLLGIERRIA
jgi:hypothetical protein